MTVCIYKKFINYKILTDYLCVIDLKDKVQSLTLPENSPDLAVVSVNLQPMGYKAN